jgi:hypothetical protein
VIGSVKSVFHKSKKPALSVKVGVAREEVISHLIDDYPDNQFGSIIGILGLRQNR